MQNQEAYDVIEKFEAQRKNCELLLGRLEKSPTNMALQTETGNAIRLLLETMKQTPIELKFNREKVLKLQDKLESVLAFIPNKPEGHT